VIIRIKKELVSKVIIIDGGKVLLLKRAAESVTESSPWTWDLPGGHVDSGESPELAANREVREEADLKLGDLHLIGTDTNIGKQTYFYVTSQWGGSIKLSHEHEDYEWVNESNMHSYEDEVGSMYYKMIMKALKTRE